MNSRDDALALQSDLDILHKWEKDWGMLFNPTKCNTISITRKKHAVHHVYSLKGVQLKAVEEAMYLGVMVAKDLSWGKQSAKVTAKGNRVLGFVKRNIRVASRTTKEKAYKALVQPTLKYASTV